MSVPSEKDVPQTIDSGDNLCTVNEMAKTLVCGAWNSLLAFLLFTVRTRYHRSDSSLFGAMEEKPYGHSWAEEAAVRPFHQLVWSSPSCRSAHVLSVFSQQSVSGSTAITRSSLLFFSGYHAQTLTHSFHKFSRGRSPSTPPLMSASGY